MKTTKIHLLLSIYSFLIFTDVLAQSFKTDTIELGNKQLSINLPLIHKKNVSNYDEGIFVDYIFKNGAIITFFNGVNQKLPLLDKERGYKPEKRKIIKNRSSSVGILNGKCWREDSYDSIRILYDNVSPSECKMFDYILDSVSILKY